MVLKEIIKRLKEKGSLIIDHHLSIEEFYCVSSGVNYWEALHDGESTGILCLKLDSSILKVVQEYYNDWR